MNDILRIRTLTDKFFNGDTTLEEEQELYDFYRQEDIPEDMHADRELFRDLTALTTYTSIRGIEADATPARSFSLDLRRKRWWLSAAAVAVLLIVGGTALYHYQRENECVAYIYGERVTDRDVVLGEMQKTMTAMTADGSDVVEEQLKAMFGNK